MNNENKNYNIQAFIEFIVDLVQEEPFFEEYGCDMARYYFMNGGCFELYKVVKKFIPGVRCMINNDCNHCAIGYNNEIYDAEGKVSDKENFRVASEEDILFMMNSFGRGLVALSSDNIIKNVEECNVKGILY